MASKPTNLPQLLCLALPLFGLLTQAAPNKLASSPNIQLEPRGGSPDKDGIQNYPPSCQNPCDGVTPNASDPVSGTYYCSYCICNNRLLGPANFEPASNFTDFFIDWKPLDSQCPRDWLCTWSNFTAGPYLNTQYYYPQNDGFKGCPENVTLEVGTRVDRFGSPRGGYLATPETSFAQRSIPPSNLNIFNDSTLYNYWQYEVRRPFWAFYGEVLPWFGQPGGGEQWYVPAGLGPLIDNGTLVLVAAKTYKDDGSDEEYRAAAWMQAEGAVRMSENEMYH
ncbi:hypothetical protein ASPACDRAFT_1855150 [Aspergillus aculeatus ATCC 16872]|uniref:TNT domain-containing protein n=1 Tax=Aspergillus aculeatus (strain ATCC 16872 / CBS 172.66 / WB 5094) TaxID=690307 RepID=A0A1L9X0L1_ASPA1|nr:uncharacterized protein ASPACDRAFT_1855150 [Aspergillus aculeatus ATCC 16872]OJK01819.1 hypothetical protein ASPACDRAFT_1855150 [Aspergillus aculeatus ATCC 16872]